MPSDAVPEAGLTTGRGGGPVTEKVPGPARRRSWFGAVPTADWSRLTAAASGYPAGFSNGRGRTGGERGRTTAIPGILPSFPHYFT